MLKANKEVKKSNLPLKGSHGKKPEVKDFINVHDYLSSVYEWRKSQSPSFSYESWAGELELGGRTFLRLLVTAQRRITDQVAHKMARGLGLKEKETEYFVDLVKFKQAESSVERDYYLTRIQKISRSKETENHIKSYRFLKNPLMPRLQTLLGVEGIDTTAENMAKALRISIKECEELLENLQEQGLARRHSVGNRTEWTSCSKRFHVASELGSQAIQSFHRKSLEEAIAAIDLPFSQRDYKSIILTMNSSEYENFQSELKEIMMELLQKYEDRSHSVSETTGNTSKTSPTSKTRQEDRRIYQINVNTIPVSEVLSMMRKEKPPLPGSDHWAQEEIELSE